MLTSQLLTLQLLCLTRLSLGDDAALSVCSPGCLHGGKCLIDPKTKLPYCECPPLGDLGLYYRGKSCQTEAVRCDSSLWCENGGTCTKLENGEEGFKCTCPHEFQGSKCQTPVAPCGSGLWCANGGSCVFSDEANSTICKCPSTHAGTYCEKMVEPQELGVPAEPNSNFTSPVEVPSKFRREDEKTKYFKLFFCILGGLIVIWILALTLVHYAKERKMSSLHRRHSCKLVERLPFDAEAANSLEDGADRPFPRSMQLQMSPHCHALSLGIPSEGSSTKSLVEAAHLNGTSPERRTMNVDNGNH